MMRVRQLPAMPAAKVTCPHCEKPVEIQVTAVTRSRPCPDCGRTIMLQVAARTSGIKHKALLMSPTPPTDTMEKPDFLDEASMYPGDAFERMCLDPELIRTRKQVMAGAAVTAFLILCATIIHLGGFWKAAPAESPIEPAQTVSLPETQPKPLTMPPPQPLIQPQDAPTEPVRRLTFRPARSEGEAAPVNPEQAVLEQFLAARTVDEKLALVASPTLVEKSLRTFYLTHDAGSLPFSHVEQAPPSQSGYSEFRVVLRDGTQRFAAVLPTPAGPRVDWPSFVALGDLEWDQMRATRPSQPVLMRVAGSAADHFTGQFSDRARLRCVRLVPAAAPDAVPLYGYVPVETDVAKQLDQWLGQTRSENGIPLTLKLSYPAQGSSRDQAWIAEVVTAGWVVRHSEASEEGN